MINFRHLLLVGIGGFVGSMLRYLVSMYVQARTGETLFPWGTLVVTVAGSLVIGLVAGFSLRNQSFEMNWRLFLATGVCGGFTTFSTFSNDSYLLLKQHQYYMLLLYVFVSFILSISATAAGYWVTR